MQRLGEKAQQNPSIQEALAQAQADREEAVQLNARLDKATREFATQKKQLLDRIAALSKGAKAKTIKAATAGGVNISAAAIAMSAVGHLEGHADAVPHVGDGGGGPAAGERHKSEMPKTTDSAELKRHLKASRAAEDEVRQQLQVREQEAEAMAQQLEEAEGRMQSLQAKHEDDLEAMRHKMDEARGSLQARLDAAEEVRVMEFCCGCLPKGGPER